MAQLGHLRELFSLDAGPQRTLFSERLDLRPELSGLFQEGFSATQTPRDTLAEDEEEYTERRNRMLDHLLARFNERFAEYAAVMATLDRELGTERDLATEKAAFLRTYPRVSAERGKGFDTGDAEHLWPSDNVSGLERRLCGLLGIRRCERGNLASVMEVYEEKDTDDLPE